MPLSGAPILKLQISGCPILVAYVLYIGTGSPLIPAHSLCAGIHVTALGISDPGTQPACIVPTPSPALAVTYLKALITEIGEVIEDPDPCDALAAEHAPTPQLAILPSVTF